MGLSICDAWGVTDPRSLDEVLADLAAVQDEMLATATDDFATRAALSNRQDALRQEATVARVSAPGDLSRPDLEQQIEHLEDEILRHLDTRPSASAGGPSGGYSGGGIDPDKLHEMHRKMAASFGLDTKKEQLRRLKNRLADLQEE